MAFNICYPDGSTGPPPIGATDELSYDRDAIPLGPFAEEPLDLWHLISHRPSGAWRSGDDIRATSAAWLLGALYAAGVDVTSYDIARTRLLFEDCETPAIQAIAGWIARARPADHEPPPDNRRASAARLLVALEHAQVDLGAYDRDLPGFLVEDCGTPAARAIAGWLARIRPSSQPDPAPPMPAPRPEAATPP
jgi:hypothetical protein